MSTDSAPFLHDPSFLISDGPCPVAPCVDAASEKPVRVLHIINGEHYAGAERVQDLLALRLPQHGYQVGFACIKPGQFPRLRQCTDAPLYEVPMKSRMDLAVARLLRGIAKEGRYELVHAHTARSCMIARVVAGMAKLPMVYHVHSPTIHDSSRKLVNQVNSWVERFSLGGVSQMIAVSESLAQHMCSQGYNPNLISIVPNGVPCRAELRPRSTPTDRWVIGTAALFRPRKGIEVLIDAISLLRRDGHDVSLRAVGSFESADYESRIKAQVAELGLEDAICWTGFTKHMDQELDHMDLFVLPSLYGEGLPMVVLEAMAAGVPVVATKVEGIPEVLRDGQFGVTAAPGCARDLASSMRRVLQGEISWEQLRHNAWKRQSQLFSDQSMAAGVALAYRRIQMTAQAASLLNA